MADVLRRAEVTAAVHGILRAPALADGGRGGHPPGPGRQNPAARVVAHEDGLAGVLHQPPLLPLLLQVVQAELLQRIVDERLGDLPVGDLDLADVQHLEEVRGAGRDVHAEGGEVGGAAEGAAGLSNGAAAAGVRAAVPDLVAHLREQLHHILWIFCLVQVAEE